jgi:hypothetical protein
MAARSTVRGRGWRSATGWFAIKSIGSLSKRDEGTPINALERGDVEIGLEYMTKRQMRGFVSAPATVQPITSLRGPFTDAHLGPPMEASCVSLGRTVASMCARLPAQQGDRYKSTAYALGLSM